MTVIVLLDTAALTACLVALAALFPVRTRLKNLSIRSALGVLILLTLIQSVFLLVEWSGLNRQMDQIEDFIGTLIPVWWGFLFYTLIQHIHIRDLRRSEEHMDLVLRGADLGTWDWDVETGDVHFNERWGAMIGYALDELAPSIATWRALLHPDDATSVEATLQAHLDGKTEFYETEYRLRHKSGGWVWVLDKGRVIDRGDDGRPLRACGTHLDITERKKLQAQLARTSRMESVGRLAGGVAHDFNNLLTPIIGYNEMMLEDIDDGNPLHAWMKDMLQAGQRARILVAQLLAFSRRQVLDVKTVDLSGVVTGFESLLRSALPETVDIEIHTSRTPCPVLADTGKLEQVILNLGLNAAQAMPEGGTLSIGTSVIEDGSARAPLVRLSVSDTGTGIEDDVLENIFEPFFTTKEELGTGLGLATTHGIVVQHGGYIQVTSEPGRGTTFEINLPMTDASPDAEPDAAEEGLGPGGTETVLLVEDEPSVRTITQKLMERRGFEVMVAADAEEALSVLAKYEDPIDLLLTDVVMPGLNGRELYERAVADRPGLRVLYMSGYAHDVMGRQNLPEPDVHFIQKPFTIHALTAKVRKVLDL